MTQTTKQTHGSTELDEDAAKLEAMGMDAGPILCPFTQMFCTGEFCDDYRCAKQAGFFDGEGDDDGIF